MGCFFVIILETTLMQDFELISAIKGLKEVKPNKEWVVLSKNRILGVKEEVKPSVGFIFWAPRLAWAPIISVFIIIGLFGFAQSAVPGNLFFSFKSRKHITGFLKVNEFVYVVFLGKPFNQLVFMLIDPAFKVVCHADVHHLMVPVGQDIDVIASP